jgi:lipopolysaccharide export system permease protein
LVNPLAKTRKPAAYRFISLLDQMIAWDLLKTISAVLSVLVIIIVSRKFIKILNLAIEGTISAATALDLLGLKTIVIIVNFLPASIFMAILMVLGRMYSNQEMAAIASAGGGAARLYRAIFLVIIPLSFVAASLSLYAAPWAEQQSLLLTSKDMETADLRGIAAGRFTEYSHGDLVFYTETIDAQLRMRHIFIQDRQHGKPNIMNAEYGLLKELTSGKYVVLENGERSQGIPGQGDFILETFKEYAVRIDKKTSPIHYNIEAIPSYKLWPSDSLNDQVELQKRFSTPLGILFLSFLAVPLAKLSPRGGVYGSLVFAFLIYFIYGNIHQISYSWVLHQTIPVEFGYFWVYGLMGILGLILLGRLYGLQWLLESLRRKILL